ncbi:MAG: hypothetical protein JNG84_04965 [Archangium sp.]|nr:hypothetical protein [Archangium sp.]
MTSEALLFKLLFDADARRTFVENRAQFLEDEAIEASERPMWLAVDAQGLELDASMRAGYLMSALCRPYVVTAAALGSAPGGKEQLQSFLASRALLGDVSERTAAFGKHLATLLELNTLGLPPVSQRVLSAFLAWERALQTNAAAIRREAEAGRVPPPVTEPTKAQLKKGRVALPPFFVAAELPLPQGVVLTALDHVSVEDVWLRIRSSSMDFDRLVAATRGTAMPVTVIARGVVRGLSAETPGVAPLVDVSHLTAELPGRRRDFFQALRGEKSLADFPPADEKTVRALVERGLLVAEPA